MILINDDKKELVSLKFIRNMLDISMNDFSAAFDVDISMISKIESGDCKYLPKYKEYLLNSANISTITTDTNIYYIEINDILHTLLYKDTISIIPELEKIDFDLVFNSKYFLDFYLICKIISVSTYSCSIITKLENDKLDPILERIKECSPDTRMLINIYFTYKRTMYGDQKRLNEIASQYSNIDKYSHYILYLIFLNNSINLKQDMDDKKIAELALFYKNNNPKRRSWQIIALSRLITWLITPNDTNYRKAIISQRKYVNVCADNLKSANFYSIISYNFIQGEFEELIENMNHFGCEVTDNFINISSHLYFMCTVASYKINDDRLYKLYLNKLKINTKNTDSKYLIEIAEKYPLQKSIKRPLERQINKIFHNRGPVNIFILMLEYNKIYNIGEFNRVQDFMAKYPAFKLF